MNKRIFLEYGELQELPKRELIFILAIVIASILVFFIPSSFEKAKNNKMISVKAVITSVDDSLTRPIGLIRTGQQYIDAKVISKEFKNETFNSINRFMGKLEFDRVYKVGDTVLANVEVKTDGTKNFQIIDIYRIDYIRVLLIVFVVFLIVYAGLTGIKAVLSFFFTAGAIWKILLPGYLLGINPILLSLGITAVLTFVIIFLIGGLNKKGMVAFLGAISGVAITCVLSLIFGHFFRIPGEIKPFAESLLYSGFGNIDLSAIFLSGIFISSSGAVMDIAMDISAAMFEIKQNQPRVRFHELLFSGLTVGRAVTGTMTTTLLLAYSGGFSTLLMIFISQGIPFDNMINLQYISAEILHTVVGSFGLVIVAPITAILGTFFYTDLKK
ncbi:MAG: YibE/F family protein [Spirochaetales bacterium]|nr:YibE/F family protein [Spirochaetales bacterium]